VKDLLRAIVLVAAASHVALGLMVAWRTGVFHDFHVFHASAVAWHDGRSPYIVPNLNPPVVVWITSPLAFFSERTAWILWQAANMAAFWAALRVTTHDQHVERETVLLYVLTQASTSSQTMLGQNAWLVALPLVLAWQAERRGRTMQAGLWLGVALAAKPFLLPLTVCGWLVPHWRRLSLLAGVAALTITAAMLPVFGVVEYRAWLTLGSGAWQTFYQPTFASVSALLQQHAGMSPAISVAATLPLWLVLFWRWRWMSPDCRWMGALGAAVATSPLGWIHYASWMLPFALRLPRTRLLWAGLLAGATPPLLVAGWPVLRPLYAASVLFWWADAVLSERPTSNDLNA